MYIFGKEFHDRWFASHEMSPERKQQVAAEKEKNDAAAKIKKARDILKNYDDFVEFVDDMENAGIASKFIERLKIALSRLAKYKLAVELGVDAGEAAHEVSNLMMQWYSDAYKKCKQDAEKSAGDTYVCLAAVVNQWQYNSVKATFNFKDENSVARKVFLKWERRLLEIIPSGR
jgi:hypothetical protein